MHRATDIKSISAPIPTPEAVKSGHETIWLQWGPGKKKRLTEKDIKDAIQFIEKLNDKNSAMDFYSKFGHLVSAYIPKYCKIYHKDVHAIPLETVLVAAGTLRTIQNGLKGRMLPDRELVNSVKQMSELWGYLPEKYKLHAKPLQEILLVPRDNTLIPKLPYDVPAWIRDYCLRAPIDKDGQINWNLLRVKVKFKTEIVWQLGFEPDIVLPKLFWALVDFLFKQEKGTALCACGCGLPIRPGCKYADPERCRKRVNWHSKGAIRRKKKKQEALSKEV